MDFWKAAAVAFLLLLGLGFIGVGMWNWFDIPDPVATVVNEQTRRTHQVVTTNGTGSTDEIQGASPSGPGGSGNKNTSSTSNTTTDTSAGPTWKKTTTKTPQPSRRSESLTLALCGIGAALVLSGAFYGRISKISWGAGSVELADLSDEVAKTVDQHQKLLTGLAVKIGRLAARVKDLEDNT